jgi:hypothetical protein
VALKNDGTVVAWGDNNSGQTTIPSGLSGVTAIAASSYTVALKNDGNVVAWGNNPTVPGSLSGVTAIAAGGAHTVALKNDGTVVAWGDNTYGQTTIPSALSGVTAIAARDSQTVALKSDGTVVAWGYNYFGQTTIPIPNSPYTNNVTGTVTYNPATLTATFTPTAVLLSNTTYIATVSGVSSATGERLASNTVWSFTTPPAQTFLGTPTIGTATAGNAQATVSFTAPASNGGAAITGYTVTSSPGNITATGSASPITITGLTNGTAYTFTVTATNSVGTSSASAASNLVTPATQVSTINGVCGPSNGAIFTVAPSTYLCNNGTPATVSGSGPWSWTCNGSNGGTSATCTALTTIGVTTTTTPDGIVIPATGKTAPTVADALAILKFATGISTPTAAEISHADVAPLGSNGKPHGDGKIDDLDVIAILRMIVGLIQE